MSLAKALQAAAGNAGAATPTDPQFPYVTMLLHGDGTNGAQNNTFLDASTNNFTITRNGNTTQGSFSPYGDNWSNYFDGTGDYLSVADNAALDVDAGNFTVEAWVYLSDATQVSPILAKGFGSAGGWMLWVQSTLRLRMYVAGGSSFTATSSASLTSNSWNHVAATRSGNTLTVYVNGVSSGTASYSGTSTNSAALEIGGYNAATAVAQGYISNARLVKGTAVYTANFTPPTAPLTAITNTQLLTCQSNRFKDASANNFTITRNGDVSVQRFSPFAPTAEYDASVIGGSGYFDGTGDYLSTPATGQFTASGDFTVSCWFYLDSFAASYYVVGGNWSATTSDEWLIQVQNNGAIRFLTSAGTAFSSAGVVKLKEWTFFCATRTGTTVTVQVNGSTVSTYTKSDTLGAANKAITIGWQPGGSWPWNGYIADFRLVSGSAVSSIPTTPLTAIAGTSLLLNMTNAGIYDNAMMNDLETVGNAQVSTSVKKFGTGSMYFDGSGDYLQTPISQLFAFGSGDFTVELWAYFNTSTISKTLVALSTANGTVIDTSNTGYIRANITVGGSDRRITGSLLAVTGQWYHIAFVRTTTVLTLYVDGVSVGTYAIGTQIADPVSAVSQVGNTSFHGYIDDLRITKGYARYTANFTPPTAAFPNQ